MLRFKILVSVVPLVVAAILARVELAPAARPCIAIGDQSVQIASAPWPADLHVSFTDDPAAATVRVQMTEDAATADFAVVDDIDDSADNGSCVAGAATQLVAISGRSHSTAPVIYLSQQGPADYRIFVRSKTFSAREAAALIVGAHGGHPHLAASL